MHEVQARIDRDLMSFPDAPPLKGYIPSSNGQLDWTGERFVPELQGCIAEEHLHRYALAGALTKGMRVLDVASGEGYGSALLARSAASVLGVEIDADSVAHAQGRYRMPNLEFRQGNALAIPAPDAEFDAVVSFETIEHLEDHAGFLREITRTLKPGGLLIVSSPEKDYFSGLGSPPNPHHVKELNREEFRSLLHTAFRHVTIMDQRVTKGSLMMAENSLPEKTTGVFRGNSSQLEFHGRMPDATYLVAVCSNNPLPGVPDSIFEYGDLQAKPFPNPYFAIGSENDVVCQLFLPTPDGHREQNSVALHYLNGRESWPTFKGIQLPDGLPQGRLRLDPANVPGVVTLCRVVIRSESGELLEDFGPGRWKEQISISENAWRIADEECLVLACFNSDPQILLPPLPKLAGRTVRVEVVLRHERFENSLDVLARKESEDSAMRAGLVEARRQLADARTALGNTQAVCNEMRTRLNEGSRQLSETRQENQRLRLGGNHCFRLAWQQTASIHKAFKTGQKRLQKKLLASGKIPKPTVRKPFEELGSLLPLGRQLAKDAAELAATGLFDHAWYVQEYPDVADSGMDPLLHYLTHGVIDQRNPNPYFFTKWYLDTNPDVAASGTNPLLHFARNGWQEGRQPCPGVDILAYLAGSASARASLLHPLLHFQLHGRTDAKSSSGGDSRSYHEAFLAAQDDKEPHWRDRHEIAGGHSPVISVVIPVYRTPPELLKNVIQSVLSQEYSAWELCLVDDGSCDDGLRHQLTQWSETDPRIKIQINPSNAGISAATNDAFALCTGEFVALLDHDDELTSDALGEVATLLAEHPDTDVVYTDQNKIGLDGRRYQPFHKPDWSQIFFLGVMFVGHLLVIRRTILKQIGGCDSRFDKVQDFELMLRVSEVTQRIRHIPKILYHWRAVPESIASSTSAKSNIEELQTAAISAHLHRLNVPVIPRPNPLHPHRVLLEHSGTCAVPFISIAIPSAAHSPLLLNCLRSIAENSTCQNFEILLLVQRTDHSETQAENLAAACAMPRVRLVEYDFPFNYSRVNNLAAQQATGDILLFLNDDTEVITPNWLETMVAHLQFPGVGVVGPKLLFPDGTVQHAGVVLGFRGTADHVMRGFPSDGDGYFGSLTASREVSAVTGACLMIRTETFHAIGGMKQCFASIYQDVDLCLRVRNLGLSVVYVANALLTHHESATRGQDYNHIDRAILIDRWQEELTTDPFYNRNFTLSRHDYTLKLSAALP